MPLSLAEAPSTSGANIFDLSAAGDFPGSFVYGKDFAYQYVRLEWVSTPFLVGFANEQLFSTPTASAGGVDVFVDFNFDPIPLEDVLARMDARIIARQRA